MAKLTRNTSPGLQGPEKIVEVILKRWFSGARTTPESTAQAAFHAATKASVSSAAPSPTAPKDVTSKTEPEAESPGLSGCGLEGTLGDLLEGGE